FFQAEDGIRDFHVTGVQTCALPISTTRQTPRSERGGRAPTARASARGRRTTPAPARESVAEVQLQDESCAPPLPPRQRRDIAGRSEERRVGQEGGCRWAQNPRTTKT